MQRWMPIGVAGLAFLGFGTLLNLFAPPPCPLRFSQNDAELPPRSVLASIGIAHAIPAASRKFNVACTTCHTAFPYLNQTGRQFKEQGYRFSDEKGAVDEQAQNHQIIGDDLVLEKSLPLSIHASSFPVDLMPNDVSDNSGIQYQFLPIHEIELLGFGNFFQMGSFMVEAEAEGRPLSEQSEGLEPEFGVSARIGFHPVPYFNVVEGFAPLFSTDPYPSLMSAHHAVTSHARILLSTGFVSDFTLNEPAPFVTVYSRVGPVYFAAGLAGSKRGEFVAINPRIGHARLAFDLTDTVAIGAYGVGGEATNVETEAEPSSSMVWRAGFDFNWSTQDFVLSALSLWASDQLAGEKRDQNWGLSSEFLYILSNNGVPSVMPLARLEWLQVENGAKNRVVGTLGASYFLRENVRLGIDGSYDMVSPENLGHFWRTTFYTNVAF